MSYEERLFLYHRRRLAGRIFGQIILEEELNRRKSHRNRSHWTCPYLLRREKRGMHQNLFLELALEDPNRFRRCLRMDEHTFTLLLSKVAPIIEKKNTNMRHSIPAAERLSLTLRHIATGESQESLRLSFRIGQSTISGIIREVCAAIVTVLQEEFIRCPKSEEEWRVVAKDFGERWNFHNCIGAMDVKHFRISSPLSSGSLYFNYKDFYSVVLLAVVDAQLRFIYVDIGKNGRISDSGIWNRCTLKAALETNTLCIPPPSALPSTNTKFPFVLVGDEIFTLSTSVMIPYPGSQCRGQHERRIFNYRLSRARRCSENAFGVLVTRFQIFRAALRYDPDDANRIILACCCLHNMLRSYTIGQQMYITHSYVDEEDFLTGQVRPGEWREEATNCVYDLINQGGNRHGNISIALRDKWCDYFNNEGAVPWQDRMVM